ALSSCLSVKKTQTLSVSRGWAARGAASPVRRTSRSRRGMASGAKAVPSERAGEELVRRGHFGWVRTPVEYDGDAGGELRQYLPARAAGRPRRVERAGYGDPAEIRCAIRSG